MRPLLWKEYRELRTTLLVWLASLLIAQSLRQFELIGVSGEAVGALFTFTGVLAAVALGSELLTREREPRTLDYLLARPVGAGQIVWAKFIAGSVALLLFIASLLAIALLPVQHAGPDMGMLEATRRAGYLASLAVVFPRLWFVLAFTLALSTLAGSRAKAAAAALLILVGGFLILTAVSQWRLWLDPDVWAVGSLTSDAHALVVESPALLSVVAAVWCVFAIAAATVAAVLFARWPRRKLGWPLLVVGGVTFCLLVPNLLKAAGLGVPSIKPVGVYQLVSRPLSILAADGSRVCVVSGARLEAIDFSDPARPKRMAEVNLPLWTFTSVRLRGSRVLLAGRLKEIPEDRAAVLVLDLGSPEKRVVATLGVAGGRDWTGSPEEIGGYLYVGTGSTSRTALRVFELTGETAGRETAGVLVEEMRDPAARYAGVPHFEICVRGDHAYLTSAGVLTTLDVRDPAHPRVTARIQYSPAPQTLYGVRRSASLAGNRLYVQGIWPRRLHAFDLTDPAHPATAEQYNWQLDPLVRLGTTRGSLVVCLPSVARPLVFAPRSGLWPGEVRQLDVSREGATRPPETLQVAFGDYLYVLADGRLAAYDIAGGV